MTPTNAANSESRTDKQNAKRASIIVGAIKAFETEGYESASMDRVAALSKASKRTVYNYFPSKEALLMAVIEDLVAGQADLKLIEYNPKLSLKKQLSKFVEAELYFVSDPTRLAMVKVLTSIFVRNPELVSKACSHIEPPHNRLILWLKAAHADKRIKAPKPALAAQMFYGLIGGLINYPALFEAPKSKQEITSITNEAISLFLAKYQSS